MLRPELDPRGDCHTPPDVCPLGCGHPYHGLPCTKHIHVGGWFPDSGRVCGCPGPWDAA